MAAKYYSGKDYCHKWVREGFIPFPPRCRKGVDSPYLPACPFRAPGDSMVVAPDEASGRCHRGRVPTVGQKDKAHACQVLPLEPPIVRVLFALELHAPD